jgi:hypothetical protein
MAARAGRRLKAILAVPRHPLARLRWCAGVVGPALALPLAVGAAGWVAAEASAICADAATGGCAAVDALAGGGAPAILAAAGVGLLLGLAHGRGGVAGRVVGWATVAAAGALPLLPALLAGAGPALLALAAVYSALAVALVVVPPRLAGAALTTAVEQRRQWWQASLRAARLTRRTLGLGVYRQLCRTGFIRVLSPLHPGRTYLVPRRTSPSGARVLIEEHGRVVGGLCLRPRQPLPDPEEAVAHVLMLRGDERAYLAAANFFPYDTVLTPQATARRL